MNANDAVHVTGKDGLIARLFVDDAPMHPSEWDDNPDETALRQYEEGDVYGYVIEHLTGGHVDSCWGFYGFEYAVGEMRTALDDAASELHNARQAMYRDLVNRRAS